MVGSGGHFSRVEDLPGGRQGLEQKARRDAGSDRRVQKFLIIGNHCHKLFAYNMTDTVCIVNTSKFLICGNTNGIQTISLSLWCVEIVSFQIVWCVSLGSTQSARILRTRPAAAVLHRRGGADVAGEDHGTIQKRNRRDVRRARHHGDIVLL